MMMMAIMTGHAYDSADIHPPLFRRGNATQFKPNLTVQFKSFFAQKLALPVMAMELLAITKWIGAVAQILSPM
jgi:hypothetical protein